MPNVLLLSAHCFPSSRLTVAITICHCSGEARVKVRAQAGDRLGRLKLAAAGTNAAAANIAEVIQAAECGCCRAISSPAAHATSDSGAGSLISIQSEYRRRHLTRPTSSDLKGLVPCIQGVAEEKGEGREALLNTNLEGVDLRG